MIRPMTTDEIRAALRHGAQVCIERRFKVISNYAVVRQDGAFFAVCDKSDMGGDGWLKRHRSPESAATFLLLVAEAIE